jgi:hypothetical protein
MNGLIAALLFATMLSACTRTVWQKPGVTLEVAQRDAQECDRLADQRARANWEPGHTVRFSRGVPPSLRQSEHRRYYTQCMRARGYTEVEVAN